MKQSDHPLFAFGNQNNAHAVHPHAALHTCEDRVLPEGNGNHEVLRRDTPGRLPLGPGDATDKKGALKGTPAEDGLRTPLLREQKPELVERGVGVDASGANRTPSEFWHTDWRTANERARTRDGLRCPEECPRSETWRMPEEVPEGCLIAVCLRKKAVVGVYSYEC